MKLKIRTIEQANETESRFSEKIQKISKHLTRLTKKMRMTDIRNETWDTSTIRPPKDDGTLPETQHTFFDNHNETGQLLKKYRQL